MVEIAELLPTSVVVTKSDFKDMVKLYADDLPEPLLFQTELMRWKNKWSTVDDAAGPKTILQAMEETAAAFYPNIHALLNVFVVMPVSVAECERSFSTLRRLKTYLRGSTGQGWLVGLAMMNVDSDVAVSTDELAGRFMAAENRRVVKQHKNL